MMINVPYLFVLLFDSKEITLSTVIIQNIFSNVISSPDFLNLFSRRKKTLHEILKNDFSYFHSIVIIIFQSKMNDMFLGMNEMMSKEIFEIYF